MKRILLSFILSVMAVPMAFSQITWEINMDEAKQKAIKENKGLLIEFTGSDWCGYCIVLKKNVLLNEAFLKLAREKYVFVELDFPKKALSKEQTEHNKKYKEIYQTEGFPTIIFADATGTPVHSFIGNRTLEQGISEINTAIERQKTLSNLLGKQKTEKGKERYDTIRKIAEIVPVKYFAHFYPNFIEDLKNDTGDSSGVGKKLQEHKAKLKLEKIIDDIRHQEVNTLENSQKVLNDYLKNTKIIDLNTKQIALELMARLYKNNKMLDEAIKTYTEAITLVPESEIAEKMQLMKKRLEADKAGILTEMKQAEALSKFINTFTEETMENPSLFIKELENYLEKNKPVPYIRYGALQLIFVALLVDEKYDEASIAMQKAIDLMEKEDKELADSVKRVKSGLEENKEALHEAAKDNWDPETIKNFHIDRWTDYSLPTK